MFSLARMRANAQERRIPIISTQTEMFLQQELEKQQPKHCFEI
jgi:predicted O-methyltransferase YrrM